MFSRFVEKYFEMKDEMKKKGASEEMLFEAVTRSLKLEGVNLRRKQAETCKLILLA